MQNKEQQLICSSTELCCTQTNYRYTGVEHAQVLTDPGGHPGVGFYSFPEIVETRWFRPAIDFRSVTRFKVSYCVVFCPYGPCLFTQLACNFY